MAEGTPILDYAKNSLSGEKITSFAGILNGTTNYILSNMATGLSFEEALKDAKNKGYVEADEALDLDGSRCSCKVSYSCQLDHGNESYNARYQMYRNKESDN